MRIKSIFMAIAFAGLMSTSPACAVDTDGDGLRDLIDVPGFNPNARGSASFDGRRVQDLDGASQLTNLQELSLSNNQITSIERGDFDGLNNLQELRLYGNPITSIESGAFEGLTNLRRLQLSDAEFPFFGTQITSIEEGDFAGLDNLQSLELGGNQITSLERGDFDGLTNLQSLYLSFNPIRSVERGAFEGLTNLQLLYLDHNQITSLESGDFHGLANLQGLSLYGNLIKSIESGAFDGLTNLSELSLNDNQITSIERGAFRGLTKLQSLNLSANGVSELNFTGARFENLTTCARDHGFEGFCAHSNRITSLVLDDTALSRRSFDAIVGETTYITDVSLVGLTFSEENPADLSNLLGIEKLDNVTVSQALFDLYADEFNAFDAIDGNTATVVPDLGDYNADGMLDAADLDLQAAAVRGGQHPEDFDHTYDGLVNIDDRSRWVEDFGNTYFGDANLDGEFNSTDFGDVLAAGEYEDGIDFNSTWGTGDFNADGDFDSSDLSFALADGGYEKGPLLATAAVPEPSSAVLLTLGLVIVLRRRR